MLKPAHNPTSLLAQAPGASLFPYPLRLLRRLNNSEDSHHQENRGGGKVPARLRREQQGRDAPVASDTAREAKENRPGAMYGP
jgi:hypothetical protein